MNQDYFLKFINAYESAHANINQVIKDNSIFDIIRRKQVPATPEELVRQCFISYLIQELNYPISFIKVEMQIKVMNLTRRCDIVIFDKQLKPAMIVECKRPDVQISQKVLEQIGYYNQALKVRFLVLTNGQSTYPIKYINNSEYILIEQVPSFNELIE